MNLINYLLDTLLLDSAPYEFANLAAILLAQQTGCCPTPFLDKSSLFGLDEYSLVRQWPPLSTIWISYSQNSMQSFFHLIILF